MTLAFVVVAALIGSARSPDGVISTLVALGSAVFVHELSRALLARSFERSSRICMSAAGGDTELSGPPLRGLRAVLFTVMGSIANALLALGYNEKEAASAMKALPADVGTADGIRQALKLLSKA